ncbi:hypothetical protein [Nonomuraea sp. NPDC048901]|uniref:hypothetical protein n=1 Tax=Nonomuraea sp. NPDC048901 TaxID=3155627 RepID=UPI0033D77CD0
MKSTLDHPAGVQMIRDFPDGNRASVHQLHLRPEEFRARINFGDVTENRFDDIQNVARREPALQADRRVERAGRVSYLFRLRNGRAQRRLRIDGLVRREDREDTAGRASPPAETPAWRRHVADRAA